MAQHVKLIAGLRFDRLDGATTRITQFLPMRRARDDQPPSEHFRMEQARGLYQPSDTVSMHLSYGTPFNNFGTPIPTTRIQPPAGTSENIETQRAFRVFDKRLNYRRVALFRPTRKTSATPIRIRRPRACCSPAIAMLQVWKSIWLAASRRTGELYVSLHVDSERAR